MLDSRRLGVFFILVLTCLISRTGGAMTCEQLFDPVTRSLDQLADLRLTLQNTDSQVLKSRLEEDFDQKLSELIRRQPQRANEIRQMIRVRLQTLHERQSRDSQAEDSKRETRKTSFVTLQNRLKVQVTTNINAKQLENWGDEDLRAVPSETGISETGVMWSHDERYVAIRYNADVNQTQPTETAIFDLETGRLVSKDQRQGLMATFGHLWGQQTTYGVKIENFLTGEKFGPFPVTRNLMAEDITPSYFVSRDHQGDTVHHYARGPLKIGLYYGFSHTKHRVATLQSGRLKIRDLITGQELPTPAGVGQRLQRESRALHGTEGYFIFSDEGVRKILFLDDLSVYAYPDAGGGSSPVEVLPDRSAKPVRAVYQWLGTQYRVTNLETGQELFSAGAPRSLMDGRFVSFDIERNTAFLADVATMTWRELPGPYQEVGDGRYLRMIEDDGTTTQHRFYDLKTDTPLLVSFKGRVDPVPGSDLWVFQQEKGRTWVSFIDAGYYPNNDLKEGLLAGRENLSGHSPSGKHFIAERDGKIVILKDLQP